MRLDPIYFLFEASEAEFLCECSDPHCAHRVEADLSDYDDIRADPTHFIVVEGHDEPRIERVVEARGGYAIVEKVGGTLRQIVRSLDPRTDPT